jgi:hypothetical protein
MKKLNRKTLVFLIVFLSALILLIISCSHDRVVVKSWIGNGVANVTDVSVSFSNGTVVELANPSLTNPTIFSGLYGQTATIAYSVPWSNSDISETFDLLGCHGTVHLTNTVTIPSICEALINFNVFGVG